MIQRLGEHIRKCLEQAAKAGSRADEISDPGRKTDFLNLEKQWLCLAQSFILCNRIERLLLSRSEASATEWLSISSAPFDRDLELAVIDGGGVHALVFPCRRVLGGWLNAEITERIDVRPTHWREWVKT